MTVRRNRTDSETEFYPFKIASSVLLNSSRTDVFRTCSSPPAQLFQLTQPDWAFSKPHDKYLHNPVRGNCSGGADTEFYSARGGAVFLLKLSLNRGDSM